MTHDTDASTSATGGPSGKPGRRFPASVRTALLLVLAAGVLAYATPIALTRLIGQEVLRSQAQAALAGALHRQVDIQGEVRLTLIPWFGLRTGPVTVANSPGFGPQPLVRVASASIGLDLLALARKRIRVESVSLASATVNLERDAQGRDNWQTPQQAEPLPLPTPPTGWNADALPTGLRLWNASLHYTDQVTGANLDVAHLNLNTTPASPFTFSLSCEVLAMPLGVRAEIHAQGDGSYGPTGEQVFVRSAQTAGWIELPGQDGQPLGRMNFSGTMGLHGEAGAVEVSQLVLEGLGLRLTGRVNASGLYEPTPYLGLKLSVLGMRHGAWAGLAGLDPPDAPALTAPRQSISGPVIGRAQGEPDMQAELELNYGPTGWKAESFSLKHDGGALSGRAEYISGKLAFDVSADNLDAAAWIPFRLPLPAAGGHASVTTLNGRVRATQVRYGPFEIAEAELTARADNGDLRIYPFTARTVHSLFSADLRASLASGKNGTGGLFALPRSFSGTASLQALAPVSGQGPLPKTVEVSVEASPRAGGLAGACRIFLDELPQDWSPPWLSEPVAAWWRSLGGSTLSCSLRLPGEEDKLLDITDLDFKSPFSRVTGRAGIAPGRLTVDLAADKADVDRLRQMAALLPGGGDGLPALPLEGKVAVKRLHVSGVDIDDLLAVGQAGPDGVRLQTLSGVALGGKFSGAADYQASAGRLALNASLGASGVQGAQLSTLLPQTFRLTGPLEGRVSLEASARPGEPLWKNAHGQADVQMGVGTVSFPVDAAPGVGSGAGRTQPWPVTRANLNLRATAKAHTPPGDKPREAALADVNGSLRLETPGQLRQLQTEIKGQAGLGQNGKPVWYRQPRLEAAVALDTPMRPGRPLRASVTGKLETDFEKGSFSLSGLEIAAEGFAGRASVSGQPGAGGTHLSGSFDIPEFSPREAAPRLGLTVPPNAAPELWRRARLSGDIGGTFREIRLTRLQGSLDGTTLAGSVWLDGSTTHADLNVGNLDLDRLSPPDTETDPKKRPDSPLPMQELRALNLDAKVRMERLVKDKLVWDGALLTMTAQGGRFRIMQSSQKFYNGSFMMDVRGDARGPDLKAQFDLALVGFDASPLLLALAGGQTLTRGVGEFHVNLETWGATDRALRRHAAGNARFEVREGRLVLREPSANRKQPPPTDNESLPFNSLGAHFSAREGLAISRDISMLGPDITAKGDGWVSLDDERIDLNLIAAVRDLGELPVRISGPLYDPRVDVDKSRLVGETIMKVLKGVITLPGAIVNQFRRVF